MMDNTGNPHESMESEENHDDEQCEDDEIDESNDSSDSEDSESERQQHNQWERQVVQLRKELSKNPNAYNLHVELIGILRKLGELDQLRNARQSMHAVYPMSEELWLEWLRDEMKLASTIEEKQKLDLLFQKAVEDYLSIDVWVEYIQFSLTFMEDSDGLSKARSVMERAVRSGGLHAAKGALLWDSFRELELATYQLTKVKDPEAAAAQVQKITQLFNRQLSIPLLDMEKTWMEYQEWMQHSNQEIQPHVKSAYEKASALLEKLLPLENELLSASTNDEKLKTYKDYLEVETKESKDPARIQALYERMLADLPLYDTIWNDYCKFVDRQLKICDTTMSVCNRAVRNCPWSSTIWVEYIFAAERYDKEHAFISGLVEKAFSGGLATPADYKNVWLAFIEFVVRKCRWEEADQIQQVREAFTRATEHLGTNFGDPECTILQYWAHVEAKRLNNMDKAREIWKEIMSYGHGKSAQWRLSCINFERMYGAESSHIRQLFQKSLMVVPSTDWPESIVHQWLQYEREEGDFQSMETAKIKCEARMKNVNEEREKQLSEIKAEEPVKGKKRNKDEKSQNAAVPAAKKAKNSQDDGVFVKPKPVAKAAAPAIPEAPITPKDPNDPSRHPRTVFVSNLDFKMTEEELKGILGTSGTITDLRLVRDYKRRSKGYCFVEFSKESEAKAALKRDREPIQGRPMFISPNEADAALKHPVFKYQDKLEKNKLFVKGLDPSVTKEDLEQLFGQYGSLKDVRIVTYKSGQSKGIAYVDFLDEVSANTALMQTDGTTFKERQMSVALSQPPPRKPKAMGEKAVESLLGGGTKVRKTQVSFVPNAVLRQQSASTSSSETAKSNADFRQMLFKAAK